MENYLKTDKTTITICIALPLILGVLSVLLTRGNMQTFEMDKQAAFFSTGMYFPNYLDYSVCPYGYQFRSCSNFRLT